MLVIFKFRHFSTLRYEREHTNNTHFMVGNLMFQYYDAHARPLCGLKTANDVRLKWSKYAILFNAELCYSLYNM